jgi:serine phosphatase RsbU (regulator of sigma subunit)
MSHTAESRRGWLAAVARNAAISISIGVAFVFLVLLSRQDLWGWRLALWGGLGGLLTYAFCHFLDATVGNRVRRRELLPGKLVGVPLYFLGGCLGELSATGLLKSTGLLPFTMSGRDWEISLLVCGVVSIVVGLLFYSFRLLSRRLQESVEKIKEQEFAEKELALARSIQSRLLPPQELAGAGYRIAARNLPARFVAGDFYDVFRLSDGALGVAVADVSGKGIGASLIMASVKAVLPLIAEGRGAAATLTELNRRLSDELAPREFVALAYARFRPESGHLELANAGLPDPYRLRPGEDAEPLGAPGTRFPLGALKDAAYDSLGFTLEPGERLLFVTDGLPEAPTASGHPLGYEALAGFLPPLDGEPPGDMLDRLFAAVRQATQPTLEDDWTALVLEARTPEPP